METKTAATVRVYCPCGMYRDLPEGTDAEVRAHALAKFWRYVRLAKSDTERLGRHFEGLCRECQELEDD